PVRPKAAYLRRDPAAGRHEERRTPEARPLKRRRILEEGGMGTPKIEFVPEKRPRRGRFGEEADPGRNPRFEKRRPDREAALPPTKGERAPAGSPRSPSRERGRGEGVFTASKDTRPVNPRHDRPGRPADHPFRKKPEAGSSPDSRR